MVPRGRRRHRRRAPRLLAPGGAVRPAAGRAARQTGRPTAAPAAAASVHRPDVEGHSLRRLRPESVPPSASADDGDLAVLGGNGLPRPHGAALPEPRCRDRALVGTLMVVLVAVDIGPEDRLQEEILLALLQVGPLEVLQTDYVSVWSLL